MFTYIHTYLFYCRWARTLPSQVRPSESAGSRQLDRWRWRARDKWVDVAAKLSRRRWRGDPPCRDFSCIHSHSTGKYTLYAGWGDRLRINIGLMSRVRRCVCCFLWLLRPCSIRTDLKIGQWSGLLRLVCTKRTPWINSSTVAANLEIIWATETIWSGNPIPDPNLQPI